MPWDYKVFLEDILEAIRKIRDVHDKLAPLEQSIRALIQ
jgi:hypothetical protein